MNDIRMVEAETRYRNARTVVRGFAIGFVCAVGLLGMLANFLVG